MFTVSLVRKYVISKIRVKAIKALRSLPNYRLSFRVKKFKWKNNKLGHRN